MSERAGNGVKDWSEEDSGSDHDSPELPVRRKQRSGGGPFSRFACKGKGDQSAAAESAGRGSSG